MISPNFFDSPSVGSKVVRFQLNRQFHNSEGLDGNFIEGVECSTLVNIIQEPNLLVYVLQNHVDPGFLFKDVNPLSTKTRLSMALEIWTLMTKASSWGECTSSKSQSENMRILESIRSGLYIVAPSGVSCMPLFFLVSFLDIHVPHKCSRC